MSDKVIRLELAPKVVDQDFKNRALNTLDDIRARVESGEIVAIAVACDHRGSMGTGYVRGDGSNVFSLVGALELVKKEFMEAEIE